MRELEKNKIIVATLNGKSYYKIINMLKLMNLNYQSLSPEEAVNSNGKIFLTSRDEANIFEKKFIILDSELDREPSIIKATILRNIIGTYLFDELIIGIDPGNRIGISIFYLRYEIESIVLTSPKIVTNFISMLLNEINSRNKIVRIGNGNLIMAKYIAWTIKSQFKDLVRVEIVNEYGTSLPYKIEVNRRGVRDKASAKVIAFRNGEIFKIDR